MNVVDVTAAACGEVCHDLVEMIEPGLMDEEVATAFLTGMIAKTKSFKAANVTPKTLQTASKLMARGAKRDLIMQQLYKTRSVGTLRLWGRALARLKTDEKERVVWTMISQQDFLHAGAQEEDLSDVTMNQSQPLRTQNCCYSLRTTRPKYRNRSREHPLTPSNDRTV